MEMSWKREREREVLNKLQDISILTTVSELVVYFLA